MNTYDILYHLVTLTGVLALVGMAYLTRWLYLHLTSDEVMEATFEEWGFYAEAEQDRRQEARETGESALRYYGLSFMVERRLFLAKHSLVMSLRTLREGGLSAWLHVQARNLTEWLVANNLRRLMNGRLGNGWTNKAFSHADADRINAEMPRTMRAFDRVQEFIFDIHTRATVRK